jgi:hypothetical protein
VQATFIKPIPEIVAEEHEFRYVKIWRKKVRFFIGWLNYVIAVTHKRLEFFTLVDMTPYISKLISVVCIVVVFVTMKSVRRQWRGMLA